MSALTPAEVLALVPQARPFRFVDEIAELGPDRIVGRYKWVAEDATYLPGQDLVPQSKFLEMCAQIGTVAWCIYHIALREGPSGFSRLVGVFTEVERAEFYRVVRAGTTIEVVAELGEEGYFRGNKLVSEVTARVVGGPDDGAEVFAGILSGMFVPKDQPAAAAR